MFGGVYFGFVPYAGWYVPDEGTPVTPDPVYTTVPIAMQTEQHSAVTLTTVENLSNEDPHVILGVKD